MKPCHEMEELLTPYLLGDLEPERAEVVRAHLEECERCRALARELEPTLDLLRGALAAPQAVPARLSSTQRDPILRPRRRGLIPFPASTWRALAGVAATLMACFILAGLLLPARSRAKESAKSLARESDKRAIAVASAAYHADKGQTPAALEELVNGRYLELNGNRRDSMEQTFRELKPAAEPPVQLARVNQRMASPARPATQEPESVLRNRVSAFEKSGSKASAEGPPPPTESSASADEYEPTAAQAAKKSAGVTHVASRNAVGNVQTPPSSPGGPEQPADTARFHRAAKWDYAKDLLAKIEDGQEAERLELVAELPLLTQSANESDMAAVHSGPVVMKGLYAGRSGGGRAAAPGGYHAEVGAAAEAMTGGKNVVTSREFEQKTDKLIIPSIEIRQATLTDAFKFLQEASQAVDPSGEGVRFNLHLPDDEASDKSPPIEAESTMRKKESSATPLITLDLRNVSLMDAVRYVSEVANLQYRVEGDHIGIYPDNVAVGPMLTRRIPFERGLLDVLIDRSDPGTGMKQFFIKAGVPFPVNSSMAYDRERNELVVSNTEENIKKLDKLMAELGTVEEEVPGVPVLAIPVFNPFVDSAAQPFSTFAIDVDTASYTLARRYLLEGKRPPPEAIRTEEFVNFFDYRYPPPANRTFAVYAEAAPSPFGSGRWLKIGVKAKRLGREEQRPAVLTIVLDTSGSMGTPDRLDLARQALRMLVDKLAPSDRLALIQYNSEAHLLLEPTPASEKEKILAALAQTQVTGSTHLEAGLKLGYETAVKAFQPGALNRVLLLSDGVANLGDADAEQILGQVAGYRKQGIYLSVFGFGIGTYNDAMLETLANKGDGAYQFIDSIEEAQRVFVDELAATLNVVAKDAKIQVEFNPKRVKQYRQLGYENRALENEQFRDDTVDAGEVGSGQSATALYQLELHGNAEEPIGVVRVRYQDVDTGQVEEIEQSISAGAVLPDAHNASLEFRLAAAVAQFAEWLRGSPYAAGVTCEDVAALLRPVALELNLDARLQELLQMIRVAGDLSAGAP